MHPAQQVALHIRGRSDEGKMSGCRKELQKNANDSDALVAGGRGFEPRLTESESVVLPLDDPPSLKPNPKLEIRNSKWFDFLTILSLSKDKFK